MGWAAITRLLARGKSLSGREPNSCFLNLARRDGSTSFADVSAATGFNFDDDSRALSFIDWDFDGDLDVWMLNRTAPAIRFLRNEQNENSSSISFFLESTTENYNAIGARLSLTSQNSNGDQLTQTRTITAGGTYLSQSSRWLHFGLGKHDQMITAKIIWPGGEVQELQELKSKTRYQVLQNADPLIWKPPLKNQFQSKPTALNPPKLSNAGRLIIANRPLFPITIERQVQTKPLLVSLWSATCPICHKELTHWTENKEIFKNSSLEVKLLNVDSDSALTQKKVEELKVPFSVLILKPRQVGTMDAFQQAISAIHLQLITPTSFLLDTQGRVAVMYRGNVSPEQVVKDLALLDLAEIDRLNTSLPYSGRWWKEPRGVDPSKIALRMHDEGLTSEAIAYLKTEISSFENGTAPSRFRPVFELNFSLARLHFKQGEVSEAISAYQKTLAINSTHLLSLKDLSRILYDQGRLVESLSYLEKLLDLEPDKPGNANLLAFAALRSDQPELALSATSKALEFNPNDSGLNFSQGLAYQSLGSWKKALSSYQKAVKHDSQQLVARNNIAWILATAPDASVRNSELAKKIIAPLLHAPGSNRVLFLRTAGAAYAEAGDFEKALSLCNEALKTASGDLKAQLSRDLTSYQKSEAIRSIAR